MRAPPALPAPPPLVSCRSLVAYDDDARRVITGVKNRDRRAAITQLADQLAALAPPVPELLVTWAPTSPARRAARGFDQAELLARAVARRLHRPVRPLLRRPPGAPQAGRSAADRRGGPRFVALRGCPSPVLLVDDVVTTGATLSAAAGALLGAGAPVVHGLVVARAPAPGQH
jgi:predicted amidophosphoribosyltransferase